MPAGLGIQMLRTDMKGLGKTQRRMMSRIGDKKTKHFALVDFFFFCPFWGML